MQERFVEDLEYFHAYINIKKSRMHRIKFRFSVMPYVEVIESIITHMDDSHHVLHSENGGQLTTYSGEGMQTYYKIVKPNEYANDKFYMRLETFNTSDIIKSWCWDPNMFFHHPSAVYPINILRDVFQYLITMYYQLYDHKNAEALKEN